MKRSFTVIVIFAAVAAAVWLARYVPVPGETASRPENAVTAPGTASAEAQAHKKIRVLLVPGHEPHSGGTSFRGLLERDLTVQLAEDLRKYLADDSRFEVQMTRDVQGWNPVFSEYLASHRADIIAWRDAAANAMSAKLASGAVQKTVAQVEHKKADDDVSVELYGINKWAGENDIDVTVHVHFNEHRERASKRPGKYSGFAIYVPSPEYGNGAASRAVAQKIFARMRRYDAVSNLDGETDGIVDEPDLIAVGAHDTAKSPSLLMEYGYIYEDRFTDETLRETALDDLAYQTYAGLRDAFGFSSGDEGVGTSALPHEWKNAVGRASSVTDVYALQTALAAHGFYPPQGRDGHDCPRGGTFGRCTADALAAFQKEYGVQGEQGFAGRKTIEKLMTLSER